MRNIAVTVFILFTLIIVGFSIMWSKREREPSRLTAKFIFGKEGKELGEFNHPEDLAIKDNYLFVGDGGNNRIQILKINFDGSLVPQSAFGKEGKGLGEFSGFLDLAIKDNYLFVGDGIKGTVHLVPPHPTKILPV